MVASLGEARRILLGGETMVLLLLKPLLYRQGILWAKVTFTTMAWCLLGEDGSFHSMPCPEQGLGPALGELEE